MHTRERGRERDNYKNRGVKERATEIDKLKLEHKQSVRRKRNTVIETETKKMTKFKGYRQTKRKTERQTETGTQLQ